MQNCKNLAKVCLHKSASSEDLFCFHFHFTRFSLLATRLLLLVNSNSGTSSGGGSIGSIGSTHIILSIFTTERKVLDKSALPHAGTTPI